MTIVKPKKNDFMTIEYEFASPSKIQKKTGAYSSKYDGVSEVITINHGDGASLTIAEWTSILAMIMSGNSTVRFYGCPVTYPTTYNTFTLFYDKSKASASRWNLNRTGVTGVKFQLGRALA
jgi:hypothetical protein